jgi:benzylsuccinate CoA-transferase BbsF subunit
MEALRGVKIVEFAAFAAGPVVGKHLVDFGATVVHVEANARPDGFRTHYPPYKDNVYGLNRSGLFSLCNSGKLGITLNLKKAPQATELARKIVSWADVVIENLKPIKPELIMLSSSNLGQTGPHAKHPGFGSQLSSLAGFTSLTGYPDGSPQILYGPYIDYIAVGYGAVAILAALDHRKRTGKGQYIDLAQYETGLQFMAPVLLDYRVNGRAATRNANRDLHMAPHGAFPCQGEDRWCVLSINSDEQWQSLCEALGKPSWAQDGKFQTLAGRKEHENELEQKISEWTRQRTPQEIVEKLQAAGVSAGVINTMKDVYTDPQLTHRGQWVELNHPEIGAMHYQRPPFILSKSPAGPQQRDPLLGEHNEYFFKELLGLPPKDYAELVDQGVID